MKKEKGITLIALIVTIVVLLILASISIKALTGDNGLINQAKNGKDASEISEEKEIVNISAVQAIDKDIAGNLKTEEFRKKLNSNAGEGKTEVIDSGETIVAKFVEKNRYYEIDKDGNVEGPKEQIKDENAGDITKGGILDGSEEKPFQINCIEDLCDFSNIIGNGGSYTNDGIKYAVLMRDLDFNSYFSYVDGKIKHDGEIKSCNSITELKETLTNGKGFYPIGTHEDSKFLECNFDGQYHEIINLYENYTNENIAYGGLFGAVWNTKIYNLTVQGNIINDGTAGGITGYMRNTEIYNCVNKCNITSNNGNAGGISGLTYLEGCRIINCSNYGKIQGKRANAGILGWDWGNDIKMYNCINASTAETGIFTSIYDNSTSQIANTLNYGKCNNIIDCTKESGISKIINCCYLKSSSDKPVNSLVNDATQFSWYNKIKEYSDEEVKSQKIINMMNEFIISNGGTEEIDTKGWAKWVQGKDGYPYLDSKTIWNGTKWQNSDK